MTDNFTITPKVDETTDIDTHITKKGFENLKSSFDNLHIDKEVVAHSQTKGEAKHCEKKI